MNQWEEEDRRRQGEMFTLVHLRQRRGQAADQAGPEQTRSKLFGYQPDPVGCHLILREQKPAERRPWRVSRGLKLPRHRHRVTMAGMSARQATLFIEPAKCDLNVRLSPNSGRRGASHLCHEATLRVARDRH